MRIIYTLLFLSCLFGVKAWGQVNITPGNSITQDFNTIGASSTATLPLGWRADNPSNVRTVGTYAAAGTTTTAAAAANMPTTATQGIYNFGNSAMLTDRSVGGLSTNTGSKSVNVYVDLRNTDINPITDFTISYTIEKYRNGSNASGFTMQLFYSTDGSGWISAGSNFTTTFLPDTDNNGYSTTPGSTTLVSSRNLPVSVAPNAHLYLAWNYSVTAGTTTTNAQALGIDDVSITANNPALSTPPTFTAASTATVDNPFTVTFSDDPVWRAAIYSVVYNGVALTEGTDYTIAASQITLMPAATNPLSVAGTKNLNIKATGYSNNIVSQTIGSGAPVAPLTIITQPAAPTFSGGPLTTQPVVNAKDKYGNNSVGYIINAFVSAGQGTSWSLGGTTGVATNSSGNAVFSNLTATNLTANPYTATITFTYGSVSVTSGSFIIPVPPPNDECINAITLTPGVSPTPVNGTFAAATPSAGSFTVSPSKSDVWYKFTTSCTGLYTISMNFAGITAGMDPGWEAFATAACPTGGSGDPFFLGTSTVGITSKARQATLLAGTVYYIRVIDRGTVSVGNFNISVTINPPVQPGAISGNNAPCFGATETYSVTPVIAGVSYNWTLPGGDWAGSLTSSSITVTAGSTPGNITVTPTTACGLAGPAQTLAVTPITEPLNVTGISVSPGNGRLTVAWNNPPNCFDEIMIVATDAANVTLVPTGDGSQYLDTTEYASAIKNNALNMNPGEYCMYKGAATAIVMTGLLNGNPYKVKIYTRWGTMWSSGIQVGGTPIVASTGDFKSVSSGKWTNYKTWNKWNGTDWVPTSGIDDYPNYFTSDVIIETGTVVLLDSSLKAVRNLEVKAGARLWTNDSVTNKYISVFGGSIICDGIIGNPSVNLADNISFNIEGAATTISGAGKFGCGRIRKSFTNRDPGGTTFTTLNILMNINLFFPGTVLYNNTSQFDLNTWFNVTLSAPYVLTVKNAAGSVAIDGTNGKGLFNAGGNFTINGTLHIPGVLYLTTNNESPAPKCTFEIGTTGKVFTNGIVASPSGTSQHALNMRDGSLLQISDVTGNSIFSAQNNPFNLVSGSTVEYKANANQLVLSGMNYPNLTLSGSGEKIISDAYILTTVKDVLTINSGITLSFGTSKAKTLVLNGTVAGPGTITGSAASSISIGPNAILTSTPLGVLKFTPGRDSLKTLIMDRMMRTDNYPNHKYWGAVLGSNLIVMDSLILNQGIIATDKYLLTLANYRAGSYSTFNKASYVATTDTLATAFPVGNTFNGSYGFRIKGVKANMETYFPVGADFISPNRAMVNLGTSATTRDLTVVLTKGDIGYTGAPRVNRIWYMHSSVNDSINANMRLYYTGYDLSSFPYMTKQDELETGFTGTNVRLVEKAVLTDRYFTNISNNSDILFNGSPGTEVFAKYTKASTIYNGTNPGIYKFNIFSIVDSGNVVLPVVFTAVRAYQRGADIGISWSVANETAIDHYEVERAGDGRLFAVVATQQAQNSGTAGYHYTAAGGQPLAGTNYYRIKAAGKDGQVLYSTVVSVALNNNGKGSLLVYPNPVKNNECNVQLVNIAAGKYNIAIYSMVGQLVAAKQIVHAGGTSSQRLNLPYGTAAGVYIVKVSGEETNIQTSVFVSGK